MSPYLTTSIALRLPLLIFNDVKLMFMMYKYYKWSKIVNTVMAIADFVWWVLLIDNGLLTSEKIAPLAIGYIVWSYANYFIYEASNFMTETSQTGILEQLYLSSVPLYLKLTSLFIAGMLFWTVDNILILGTILIFYKVFVPFKLIALIPFFITIVGIVGIALITAGVSLIFKRSQSFAYMMVNILLFLNGSILPLEKMPYWLQLVSNSLPTTQGIEVIRNMIFNGQTVIQSINNFSLILLIINSGFYFILGWYILSKCQEYAQNKGIIGHY